MLECMCTNTHSPTAVDKDEKTNSKVRYFVLDHAKLVKPNQHVYSLLMPHN